MRLGTPEFVGERLHEAREARGLTGSTLAELIAVSRQAISQYEKDQQTPAPAVMDRICSVLTLPREYFFHRSHESVGPLFFRSYASATKTERTRQHQRQRWRRRIIAFLSRYVSFPEVRIPLLFGDDPSRLGFSDIERFAVQARRAFGLKDGPISDVALLLENHGAILVRTQFEARTLDAFSEWSSDDDRPYIVLNADKRAAVRSRFDAAHELAHILIHRPCDAPLDPRSFKTLETQAHRFAGAFLAPADAFAAGFHPGAGLDHLLELKNHWRVSLAALARRACDLGLVSPFQYRRYMTEIGRRGWRSREPLDDEFPCEEPRLIRRSVELLLQGRIVHASAFGHIGAGSIRDVQDALGLPDGCLEESCRPPSSPKQDPPVRPERAKSGRIIRLSNYLRSSESETHVRADPTPPPK
jgi:Zn-dependent peptidase ImmA (M78 family)/transcriptional regulator with XRE-family HTH domain